VGHEAGEDDRRAGAADQTFKFGPGEGAGERLLDNGFAVSGLQLVDEVAAPLRSVEQAAVRALVGDMDDPTPGPARRLQQHRGAGDRRLHAHQLQRPVAIFVLVVDQDQRRLAERRGGDPASGQLDDGPHLGHDRLSLSAVHGRAS
jgi:hypothetical protein